MNHRSIVTRVKAILELFSSRFWQKSCLSTCVHLHFLLGYVFLGGWILGCALGKSNLSFTFYVKAATVQNGGDEASGTTKRTSGAHTLTLRFVEASYQI